MDAVRASASIPYFFEPVSLTGPHGTSTLVDGGTGVELPDLDVRPGGRPAAALADDRRPAELAREVPAVEAEPVQGTVQLGAALVETAIEACQAEHVLDPCNVARTVAVDTTVVSAVDFDIDAAQRDRLIEAGRSTAASASSRTWDYPTWLSDCRSSAAPSGQSSGRSSSA